MEFSNKGKNRDFPRGTVDKNPPAKTGDTGSTPGLARSHMPRSNYSRLPQLLNLCCKACGPQLPKPACLGPTLCNKRSHCHARTPQLESRPPLAATREGQAQQQRPSTAKNNLKNKQPRGQVPHQGQEVDHHALNRADSVLSLITRTAAPANGSEPETIWR